MKISRRKQVSPSTPVSGTSRGEQKAKTDGAGQTETRAADVSLSETMREVEKAGKALSAMADVRAEKVGEIKPVVDDGSYHVESKVIAKKMVDTSLRESAQAKTRRRK